MKPSVIGKTVISPLHAGSCVSYELDGNRLTIRLLGLMPIRAIAVEDIRSLRPAAKSEVSRLAFALNWMLLYCWRPAYRPIYLLQTGTGRRYLPRLDQNAHKQLLLAMKRSRSTNHSQRNAA